MNNELKTMAEKMAQDPKEIMENGLTREQNEKIKKDSEAVGGLFSLIAGLISLYVIFQVMTM